MTNMTNTNSSADADSKLSTNHVHFSEMLSELDAKGKTILHNLEIVNRAHSTKKSTISKRIHREYRAYTKLFEQFSQLPMFNPKNPRARTISKSTFTVLEQHDIICSRYLSYRKTPAINLGVYTDRSPMNFEVNSPDLSSE